MKLGQTKRVDYVCRERECFECGEPAFYRHTYLLESPCRNPQSKAYGRDDCTWCEDECSYACEEHKNLVEKKYCPDGMICNSTFYRNRFEHMFLYWDKESEEIINGSRIESKKI